MPYNAPASEGKRERGGAKTDGAKEQEKEAGRRKVEEKDGEETQARAKAGAKEEAKARAAKEGCTRSTCGTEATSRQERTGVGKAEADGRSKATEH